MTIEQEIKELGKAPYRDYTPQGSGERGDGPNTPSFIHTTPEPHYDLQIPCCCIGCGAIDYETARRLFA